MSEVCWTMARHIRLRIDLRQTAAATEGSGRRILG
jgi:hypothetical protein